VSSVDGGAKARPEMYSLAARQVLAAVGNDLSLLTKDNIRNNFAVKINFFCSYYHRDDSVSYH